MREDHSIDKIRDKLQRDLRRNDMQSRFVENRRKLKAQQIKNQIKQFQQINSLIDENSFSQHIQFIQKFTYNQNVNFRLLSHSEFLYSYIIENPYDQKALFILEGLTNFQQINMPVSEQLVEALGLSLNKKTRMVLNCLANLLDIHNYSQIIRDSIIEQQFLQKCEYVLRQNYQQPTTQQSMYLWFIYTHICCKMISTHPTIDIQNFHKVLNHLQNLIFDETKFTIATTLETISCSFDTHKIIAQSLYMTFNQFCLQNFIYFEESIIKFISFCIRSKVSISLKLFQEIQLCFQSCRDDVKIIILNIFSELLKQEKQVGLYIFSQKLKQCKSMLRVLKIYETVSEQAKLELLSFIKQLFYNFLLDLQSQKAISSRNEFQSCFEYIEIILKDGLSDKFILKKNKVLQIILIWVKFIQDQKIKNSHSIILLLQKTGIISIITTLAIQQLVSQTVELLQQILLIYETF